MGKRAKAEPFGSVLPVIINGRIIRKPVAAEVVESKPLRLPDPPKLTSNDPQAYEGLTPKLARAETRYTAPCPVCHGYGEWVEQHNVYNNPRWPHRIKPCNNCSGCGYVKPEHAGHLHQFKYSRDLRIVHTIGAPAYYEEQCSICGESRTIDSSD